MRIVLVEICSLPGITELDAFRANRFVALSAGLYLYKR